MIYAEIFYLNNNKDYRDGYYLKFFGKKANEYQIGWDGQLMDIFNSTKGTEFHDIYFKGKYLVNREFVLEYLATNNFTPVSNNLFTK